ncbi:MAG: sigma-54-dependent Fis family transcriptional regulator [Betaproteobacteria bacterium]|nr:sigma-54-dependent Fis family transcriptional regulator [Betaproteobacteria bacterium]
MSNPRVLIVDDEPDLLDLVELTLANMGLDAARAKDVAGAKAQLARRHFDLCLTDMRLPDGDGLEIVRHVAETSPSTPVAVITAHGSADNAVAALKAGAYDYVSKPVSLEQLRALVRTALKTPDVEHAAEQQKNLVGDSPAMRQVRALIEKVARSQAPVFILGETGTGKEVAARMIHADSRRGGKPFVAVNCGAIPENLMESEFFGYRKGAFTGADADRDGFFHAADGGTLFLDEVAELPMSMQVKLLRAVQEKRVRRIGASQEEPVDARLISASHQDLARAVEAGRFRHDLFYRLDVIELKMPPLRERREDIPALVEHIVGRYGFARDGARLAVAANAALLDYAFPGNVRELENILERAFALGEGEIGVEGLNLSPAVAAGGQSEGRAEQSLQDYLDKVEREAILAALKQSGGNKTAAAKQLGVTFRSLRYRLERLGID